jgi:hypothetical protein
MVVIPCYPGGSKGNIFWLEGSRRFPSFHPINSIYAGYSMHCDAYPRRFFGLSLQIFSHSKKDETTGREHRREWSRQERPEAKTR